MYIGQHPLVVVRKFDVYGVADCTPMSRSEAYNALLTAMRIHLISEIDKVSRARRDRAASHCEKFLWRFVHFTEMQFEGEYEFYSSFRKRS